MKLIKQSKLFFKEGNSDKVYEIDLCQLSENEYLVNFRYGKRGAKLKEGTKTPSAVDEQKAESVFSALEKEKRGKGYQSESEMFVELPEINVTKPTSEKETILLRLQDAVEKKNSFKTEWKTSRVIAKASALNITEAIPFILKLSSRGDELQLYSSICALLKFEALEAGELFKSYALSSKQKAYIRNMATEGWIALAEKTNTVNEVSEHLIGKMPLDIKSDIEQNDLVALANDLKKYSNNKDVHFFSDLYLLARINEQLRPLIQDTICEWTLTPPYFKYIRSIYKLGQIRCDYKTIALLSYRFETEKEMFKRSVPLKSEDDDYYYNSQYIESLQKSINIGKELKKADSKLAFSQYTKTYLQRNSLNTLFNIGLKGNAKDYLRLAVAILLQYKESDYRKAEERPINEYGEYKWSERKYYFNIGIFPECYNSLLLTNILFGNDKKRILQKNLTYLTDKYTVKSNSWSYNPANVERVDNTESDQNKEAKTASVFGFIKKIFNKEEKTSEPHNEVNIIEENDVATNTDCKLFPQLWDSMPQAYIQLLVQGQMNVIHEFAYNNLKKRTDYQNLLSQLDAQTIIALLTGQFAAQAEFGYDALMKNESEFNQNPQLIVQLLDSQSTRVVEWAKKQIERNTNSYFDDLDFTVSLVLKSNISINDWIYDLLSKLYFSDNRLQAILGKSIVDIIEREDTDHDNEIIEIISKRILLIAKNKLQYISWSIIEQLVSSAPKANIILASYITKEKVTEQTVESIPFSLIQLFLQNYIPEVRNNGVELLSMFSTSYYEANINKLFDIIAENTYADIVSGVLQIVNHVIKAVPATINDALQRIIYILIRKETFEGSHQLIISFAKDNMSSYFNNDLQPKHIVKILFSQYRSCQLFGFEILKDYTHIDQFSIAQVVALGNHELLMVRQWVRNFFNNNIERIKYEKDKALGILDSKWDDSREFAFHYFRNNFEENDWTPDTLISITDSIRNDVENFGRELITKYFNDENGLDYLTRLSQHPSINIQILVTNYLNRYASGKADVIADLDHYFRSVLTRVNKARVAKNRIFKFLETEALSSVDIASVVLPIIDDISAQSTIQDKSTCIHILANIKNLYPHLDMHLSIKN